MCYSFVNQIRRFVNSLPGTVLRLALPEDVHEALQPVAQQAAIGAERDVELLRGGFVGWRGMKVGVIEHRKEAVGARRALERHGALQDDVVERPGTLRIGGVAPR